MITFDANHRNYTRLTSNRHDVRVFVFGFLLGCAVGGFGLFHTLNPRYHDQVAALTTQITTLEQERDAALEVRETASTTAALCQTELKKTKKPEMVLLPKQKPQTSPPLKPLPKPALTGKLLKVGESGDVGLGVRLTLIGISRHATGQYCIVLGNNIPDSVRIPSGGKTTINNLDQSFTLSADLQKGTDSCRIAAQQR